MTREEKEEEEIALLERAAKEYVEASKAKKPAFDSELFEWSPEKRSRFKKN